MITKFDRDSAGMLRTFHNHLRILRSIDRSELVEAGMGDPHAFDVFTKFSRNPYEWFIHCSDEDAAIVWKVIEGRQ